MSMVKPCETTVPSLSRCGTALVMCQRTLPSGMRTRYSLCQGTRRRTDSMAERRTCGTSSGSTRCSSRPWSRITSPGATPKKSRTASLMYCTLAVEPSR